MTYDENNLFAKILKGDTPCDKVYEDDHVLACKDKYPKAPVHLLVLTKKPYISMNDFTEKASASEIEQFFKSVAEVAREQGLVEQGYRISINVGEEGGQEIPHLHVHITSGKY